MKILLLSAPKRKPEEAALIAKLFERGLDTYHIRKPDFSYQEMHDFLYTIPKKYWNCIVLHSHYKLVFKLGLRGIHISKTNKKKKMVQLKMFYYRLRYPTLKITTSFNNLSSLFEETTNYDYVFLSPIFDSITKSGYQSAFSHHNLEVALEKTKYRVMALGGIEPDKVKEVKRMGFAGLVLSGHIWNSLDMLQAFEDIKKEI